MKFRKSSNIYWILTGSELFTNYIDSFNLSSFPSSLTIMKSGGVPIAPSSSDYLDMFRARALKKSLINAPKLLVLLETWMDG